MLYGVFQSVKGSKLYQFVLSLLLIKMRLICHIMKNFVKCFIKVLTKIWNEHDNNFDDELVEKNQSPYFLSL